MELVRRITCTERPGYEPDGDGFVQRVTPPLTSKEKRAHPWACDMSRGDVQCPYVTPHGGDGLLNCAWRRGHPETLTHTDSYDDVASAGPEYWFVPGPHEALFRFAKAVNAREQEKKAMICKHGKSGDCTECMVENKEYWARQQAEYEKAQGSAVNAFQEAGGMPYERSAIASQQIAQVDSWAPPETLSAKLSRFLFQIQNTQTSLSELQREVEKLRAAL